jgi:hypothetical protein
MICNMLEKIQAEFSRLLEVDYNGTARGVQWQYTAVGEKVRNGSKLYETVRNGTKRHAIDIKNCTGF